jgi:hypothetical protein
MKSIAFVFAPLFVAGLVPGCGAQSTSTGGGEACTAAGECPQPSNECQVAACNSGKCAFAPKAEGAICAMGNGSCDGNGQCNLCEPGLKACNGADLLVCGDSGTFDPPITCTGDTPFCDPGEPKCVACYEAGQCITAGMNPCLGANCVENTCVISPVPNGSACIVDGDQGTCTSGQCNVCINGDKRCAPGAASTPQVCVNGVWIDQAACAGTCVNGSCA